MQYEVIDDVVYHVEADHTLRVIPPAHLREALSKEVYSGLLSGHLHSAEIHGQLAKPYWWSGMRADIVKWSRACMVCATSSWACLFTHFSHQIQSLERFIS